MADMHVSRNVLKQVLKEALAETLHEERVLLRDIVAEVLEDLALAETLHEAEEARKVTYDDVMPHREGLA
ncbi:MAG: hypothetical protein R3247_17125 [Rhodothermales bacterium]|nr:hypothetical protein [Rhodothermales bacterium]